MKMARRENKDGKGIMKQKAIKTKYHENEDEEDEKNETIRQ